MDDGADCNVENVDWEYQTDLQVRQLDCLDPGLGPHSSVRLYFSSCKCQCFLILNKNLSEIK